MQSFYWLVEGVLAGCSRPGGRDGAPARGPAWDARRTPPGAPGAGDPSDGSDSGALEADLAWLRGQGIGAVLSLTETPLPAEALARYEITALHLPVRDLTAPTPEQLERALDFIDRQRALGHAVAVHCLVGEGRTGTVLAAYLVRGGMTAEQALRELRAQRPGALGTSEQEHALRAFAVRRDWIV
jgi:atypical dual specificity phosphatase